MASKGRGASAPLLALVLLLLILHIAIGGSLSLNPLTILQQIIRGPFGDDAANVVVWQIRLPRALTACSIGAVLAVVGCSFQAVFRNPLAEPYIIGVSSGASLGGSICILLGLAGFLGGAALPLFGFAGGMAALAVTFAIGRDKAGAGSQRLLIAGVVVGSVLSALTSLILILAGKDTNEILRWLLGSVTPAEWMKGAVLASVGLIVAVVIYATSRRLNAIAISEDASERAGVDVDRVRKTVLVAGTAGAAAAVGAAGVIPFVGLVAPHIGRRLVGEDLRRLLPVSALIGSGLLVAADLLAQRIKLGSELPVGAVCAVLGAPVLLAILRRRA